VVVLTVLRALEEAGVETEDDLLFIGTVGEEGLGDLRGMKYLYREGGLRPDVWIDVDGGGLDRIVSMGLGSVRYVPCRDSELRSPRLPLPRASEIV
jgi:acetylornithine deacetylase/succinyl-diaminopimelate desuccinylase-like protein